MPTKDDVLENWMEPAESGSTKTNILLKAFILTQVFLLFWLYCLTNLGKKYRFLVYGFMFCSLFWLYCLTNLGKSIDFWWMVFLWCELLCKRSLYILKRDQWITIWWGKFELYYYYYRFVSIQIQSHLRNCGTSDLISKKNTSKFLTLTLHSLFCILFALNA